VFFLGWGILQIGNELPSLRHVFYVASKPLFDKAIDLFFSWLKKTILIIFLSLN